MAEPAQSQRLYNTRILMNAVFQLITEDEIETVLPLMREFYAQQQMRFDQTIAAALLAKVAREPALGQVYLIFRGPELAGYFALTFCFSFEFHGRFGLLDELYIREPYQRQKLGRSAVEFAERTCREKRIKALRLEVGIANAPAHALYVAEGFAQDERHLMTKWL